MLRAAVPILLALVLCACGLKDDLYLPEPKTAPVPAGEARDADEEEQKAAPSPR